VEQLEVEPWAAEHVELTAPLEIAHERPWATVWRAQTRHGVAWAKACAPVQSFEPRLTAVLASRRPGLLPEVIARNDERAWLLLGDAGDRLGFGAGPEPWLSLLPVYAELQREEIAYAAAHLGDGVPDRRPARFPELYERMVSRELPISDGDRARLREFAPSFERLSAELASAGPGDTIQHDDLHGNNIYSRTRPTRILDWGDACVSHPFLTTFVTFDHLEEVEHLARDDLWFDRLRDAYLEPWGRPAEFHGAFEMAQRLGPFAHLFKQLRVFDAIRASSRAYDLDLAGILARCVAIAA